MLARLRVLAGVAPRAIALGPTRFARGIAPRFARLRLASTLALREKYTGKDRGENFLWTAGIKYLGSDLTDVYPDGGKNKSFLALGSAYASV